MDMLRKRTFDGFKFRRQVPLAGYIVDFYCPELNLAIEMDGSQHSLPCVHSYDDHRALALRRRKVAVLRIPNVLIAQDLLMVVQQIEAAIGERCRVLAKPPHPPSAPSPPRSGGEGRRKG